jgi:type II secretory pathway pseudopilin PulG
MKLKLHGKRRFCGPASGFSLIEVTIALGVAAFCLLTIFGLLPMGLSSNQGSMEQTAAANISSAILADLRSAQPLGANSSPRYGIPIPTPSGSAKGVAETSGTTLYLSADGRASENGQVVEGGTNTSRYRATIAFTPPGSGERTATAVRVLITWPALADPTPGVWQLGTTPMWPANYAGSYEADTTLDRN